jgi:hypothetical protein
MSRLEVFNLIAGLVGLIVDLVSLAGFISGFVVPHPSWGLFGDPIVLALVTFTIMVYGIFICLFFIMRAAWKRWEMTNRLPSGPSVRSASMLISYALWIPATVVWGVAVAKLFLSYYHISFDSPNENGQWIILGVAVCLIIIVPYGGYLLNRGTVIVVDFFYPLNWKGARQDERNSR